MRVSGISSKGVKSGTPTGRTGDGLNVGLLPYEDAMRRPGGPLPYEWWYFDASFDNGYSAVAILWPMNYAKPWRRQCTLQLSIYAPDGEYAKHYLFPPGRLFSASCSTCDVRVGASYMRGRHPRYEVRVEAEGDAVDLTFEAETPGWKPGNAVTILPAPPRFNTMGWLVPLPRARVVGNITFGGRDIEVTGHGYHDHNWGEAFIFHYVDNWHWGHIVCGDTGIIWSEITMDRSLGWDRTYMFLLSRGDRLVYEAARIDVAYEDWLDSPEHPMPYPRTITVSFGEPGDTASGRFTMSVQSVVETQNLLDMAGVPPLVQRVVNRRLARPYYFRWRSTVTGEVTVGGESIPLECETIHEQMLFRGRRPAIDAALQGPGLSHTPVA